MALGQGARMTARFGSVANRMLLLVYPASYVYDRWRRLSFSFPRPAASPPGSFSPAERATIEAVVGHLVPTDHEPGAREVGAVAYIESAIAVVPELSDRYRYGAAWLDYAAKKGFHRGFLALTADQQRRILAHLDLRGQSRLEQRRLALFYRELWLAREFFWMVRRHAFEAFYTNGAGRRMIGFAPHIPTPDGMAVPSSLRFREP
jgi:hypothetical protein